MWDDRAVEKLGSLTTCIYFCSIQIELASTMLQLVVALWEEHHRDTELTGNQYLWLGEFDFHGSSSPLKAKVGASAVIKALHTYKQVQISLPVLPLFCLHCCKQKDVQLRHGQHTLASQCPLVKTSDCLTCLINTKHLKQQWDVF